MVHRMAKERNQGPPEGRQRGEPQGAPYWSGSQPLWQNRTDNSHELAPCPWSVPLPASVPAFPTGGPRSPPRRVAAPPQQSFQRLAGPALPVSTSGWAS